MDADALRDAIEDEYETELSRLGSSKAMYAVTEGEMEPEAVREAMADRALAAAETFAAWADVESGAPAETFAALADSSRDRAERTADDPSDDPTPLEEHLRGLDGTAERAGGALAWALATDATLAQAVGFFVGNADPRSADLFRDLRSELESDTERIDDLLDSLPEGDRDAAEIAASGAIEAAYEHYAETLEGLGVKVKPVC